MIERPLILVLGALLGATLAIVHLRHERTMRTVLPVGSCAQQVTECVRLGGYPDLQLASPTREFTCTKTVKVMP